MSIAVHTWSRCLRATCDTNQHHARCTRRTLARKREDKHRHLRRTYYAPQIGVAAQAIAIAIFEALMLLSHSRVAVVHSHTGSRVAEAESGGARR